MLRRLIGEDIDLEFALRPELGMISADPGQIEQIVMNLVVNARDAMPKGGTITIETANVAIDESYSLRRLPVKAGPYTMIAVSDNGSGMDEIAQERLFEPFFTTKVSGRGTGLGLSSVYRHREAERRHHQCLQRPQQRDVDEDLFAAGGPAGGAGIRNSAADGRARYGDDSGGGR